MLRAALDASLPTWAPSPGRGDDGWIGAGEAAIVAILVLQAYLILAPNASSP